LPFRNVQDGDRHFMQASHLRRPPAPLAGDDLVPFGGARNRSDHKWLNDPVLAH
jgi:hypothetical protein